MENTKNRKTDRRTVYTRNVIREAFLAEMKVRDYSKITVTDLCKKAEINRSTFYLHYTDVLSVFDELLEDLLNEMLEGLGSSMAGHSIAEVLAHSELIYQRIMKDKAQVFLLQKGFTYPPFVDRFTTALAEELLVLLPESPELSRSDQFMIVKSLMYSYIQLDLQTLKKHSVKELEHFNALLNTYLITPCVEKLLN